MGGEPKHVRDQVEASSCRSSLVSETRDVICNAEGGIVASMNAGECLLSKLTVVDTSQGKRKIELTQEDFSAA